MPSSTTASDDRMRAIELLLLWEGGVSRARLLDFFNVAPVSASRALTTFRRAHPRSMHYDTATRSFLADLVVKPKLTRGEFGEYVRLLGTAADPGPKVDVPFEAASALLPRVPCWVFSRLHRAIRGQLPITIMYRSMRDPEPHARTLRPHALAQAGSRWHVRAYCAETEDFRDFNLARIASAEACSVDGLRDRKADVDWNTITNLRLVPHEGLTPAQQRLVRHEYFRGAVYLTLDVRVAMLRYMIQAYRAAIDAVREPAPDHLLMVHRPDRLPTGHAGASTTASGG